MATRRRVAVVLGAASLALALGLALGLAITIERAPRTSAPLSAAQRRALDREMSPEVVDISVTAIAGGLSIGQAGTGMVVSSDGLVLTNNHVLRGAVHVVGSVAGRRYRAVVVATDPGADLALIRLVGAGDLRSVRFVDSAPSPGERVVALGNALGLGHRPRLVVGEVLALGRTVLADDLAESGNETLRDMIEADARVVAGFSGGPLANAAGGVVGVDTAEATEASTGSVADFAIPASRAASFLAAARAGRLGDGIEAGSTAWLGILDAPAPVSSGFRGVTLAGVVEGSPAARAGLVAGDTVTAIDGRAVASLVALEAAVDRLRPAQRCTVSLRLTSGQTTTVVVRLGALSP